MTLRSLAREMNTVLQDHPSNPRDEDWMGEAPVRPKRETDRGDVTDGDAL